jgi:hypothetical protein
MKALLLFILLSVGISGCIGVSCIHGNAAVGPLYTVTSIRAVLSRHPAAVVGRTIRVRGILEGPFVFCGETRPCPPPTLGLIDAENASVGPDQYLPVIGEPPRQVWAFLHRIPPLAALLPAPQRLQYGVMAMHRLELRAAPGLCSRNADILCYEGVIVDAVP